MTGSLVSFNQQSSRSCSAIAFFRLRDQKVQHSLKFIWWLIMTKPKILQEEREYTFRSYFEMTYPPRRNFNKQLILALLKPGMKLGVETFHGTSLQGF